MADAVDDLLGEIEAYYCGHADPASYRAGVLCRMSLLEGKEEMLSTAERIALLVADAYWVDEKDLAHTMKLVNNLIATQLVESPLSLAEEAKRRAVMTCLLAYEYVDPEVRYDVMSRFVEYIRIVGIPETELESALKNLLACLHDLADQTS